MSSSGAVFVDFFFRLPKHLRLWFFKTYLDVFSLHCLKRAYSYDRRPFYKNGVDEAQFQHYVRSKSFEWLDIDHVRPFLLFPRRTLPHSVVSCRARVIDSDICVFCFRFCTPGERYNQIQGEWACKCARENDGTPDTAPLCDTCYEAYNYFEMDQVVDIHGHSFLIDCCYQMNN